MTQKERRVFLINYLKNEEESFKGIVTPMIQRHKNISFAL